MGEFGAGKWLIGMSIYFFLFYVVITATLQGHAIMGTDPGNINVQDPGFENAQNQFASLGNECVGLPSGFIDCTFIRHASDGVCGQIPGCSFNSTFELCEGKHNISSCSQVTNATQCQTLGCTVVEDIFPTQMDLASSFDWTTIRRTFGIMTGFSATIDVPPAFHWIFSFMFFWIPFSIFLYALYMVIPFIH